MEPSFAYGRGDPLDGFQDLSVLYTHLTDGQTPDVRTRAERAILQLVSRDRTKLLDLLPLGIVAPLREAARTCQLNPPPNWPLDAYMAIGRNDLAALADENVEHLNRDGLRINKDFFVRFLRIFKWLFLLTILFST